MKKPGIRGAVTCGRETGEASKSEIADARNPNNLLRSTLYLNSFDRAPTVF